MAKDKKNIPLLRQGDVIKLKKGMDVYALIPEMFVIDNRRFSKELIKHEVKIGKVYKNPTKVKDQINEIIKDVKEAFSYQGYNLQIKDAEKFVTSKVKTPKSETFEIEEGEYLVTKTSNDGGGMGMGPHDTYSNGHHVFCKKLNKGKFDKDAVEVNFYQTGAFTAMIRDIKVIRKMQVSYA
jgi:hypothetical protein